MGTNEKFMELCLLYQESQLSKEQEQELFLVLKQDHELLEVFRGFLALNEHLVEKYHPEKKSDMFTKSVQERLRILSTEDFRKQVLSKNHQRSGPQKRKRGLHPVIWSLAALGLMAISLFLFNSNKRIKLKASISKATNNSFIIRGGDRIAVSQNMILYEDDILFVPYSKGQEFVEINYPLEKTLMKINSNTEIQFKSERGGKHLRLLKGSVHAIVAKQRVGHSMNWMTSQAFVKVLGTEFTLSTKPEQTRLEVQSGEVSLTRKSDRKKIIIQSGQFAIASSDIAMVVRESHQRITKGLIAFYDFKDQKGIYIHDQSNFKTSLDLKIEKAEAVKWLGHGGIELITATRISSVKPAVKIQEACTNKELTLEVWLTPKDNKKNGTIISIMGKEADVNIKMALRPDGPEVHYNVHLRTGQSKNHKNKGIGTSRSTKKKLTHLVFTYHKGLASIFINGVKQRDRKIGGVLSNWNNDFKLTLANDAFGVLEKKAWLGEFHLLAFYNRALSLKEVKENFKAGAQ